MNEALWLEGEPDEMYFRAVERLQPSARKQDLFCLACVRVIWDLLEDDARRPFRWLENHLGERKQARSTGHIRDLFLGEARSLYDAHHRRQGGVAGAATHLAYDFWAGWYEYAFPNLCEEYEILREMLGENPRTLISSIILDIFGTSLPPVSLNRDWRTAAVVAIARRMYESGDFSCMPSLADALRCAGCDDETILNHCRQPLAHVRGCWLVDAVIEEK